MGTITAITAARKLAAQLALPTTRGTVFAWISDGQERLVVRADQHWLRSHRTLPKTFMGFPVTADDPSDTVAFH